MINSVLFGAAFSSPNSKTKCLASSSNTNKNEFITSKELYKEIKIKDGATFSKFYLIPNSAHFNVIENPESCAAAVYNFINLENNNLNGENNVS